MVWRRNAEIFAEIVPAVLAAVADPIFLVATNPLDVMTQIVTALAGRHGVAPQRRNLRGDRAGSAGCGSRSYLSCRDQSARRHDPDCDCPRWPAWCGAAT